ncbi:3-dehydroquinate dehydratase (3-dehydroquinase) [Coemansia javaensis]|uniref:Pentafunctional AROM polypeptide n=1 Tax=Coemansia javaensis TaxID=2761396 RepID=A0A9W8H5P6_9FUNG|nr:3-dehydroquinate dehydratase (3-dehydroquinase) [Coemansia javaensis]
MAAGNAVVRIPILGSESIVCGHGLADYMWEDMFASLAAASTYVVITDTNLGRLYMDGHRAAFAAAWGRVRPEGPAPPRLLVRELAPGEASKSREVKAEIEDWMLAERCTRDTTVVALGGGVIGDLAGFVAATFMRGVGFVQVPTSLLAMVDSSIGGKTAVDTPAGKNLIGAFWQPQRIYMDMAVLATLPEREFANGMAEVIKTAAIWDAAEFAVLEAGAAAVRAAVLDGERAGAEGAALLLRVIAASARVKAHVVTHDERESGLRGLLNFGHTIGHALEAELAPHVLHGECVAVGCVLEAEVACRLGHLSAASVGRLARCLRAYGLPTAMDDPLLVARAGPERMARLRPARLMRTMGVDKKNIGAQKRLVLLRTLGATVEPRPLPVADALIEEVVSAGVHAGPLPPRSASGDGGGGGGGGGGAAAAAAAAAAAVVVVPPGSKSISNRALLMAALGSGPCRIRNLLHSDDTQVMLAALQAMGGCSVAWEDGGDTVVVTGRGGRLHVPPGELYLGNAGTAARFLAAAVALAANGGDCADSATVLTGNARMRQRPIGPLVDALRANGTAVEYCEREGSLPLRVAGGGLAGGRIQLAASVSSQYVSAILLCAPYAREPVRLELVGGKVISQPYIDMTIAMMAQFGCRVERVDETTYVVPAAPYVNPPEYTVESDASSATYPLAVAAITGGTCTVPNIGSASLQGDARFAVDVLRPMGCHVEQTATSTTVRGPARGGLRALPTVDMEPMTDAFLTAAVLAAVAAGGPERVTRIRGIANQHVKECDRIAAMCAELARFGVAADDLPDGIDVHARPLAELAGEAPSVHCYDDHRVAMSLSVLACVAPAGAEIRERRCVGKTWPQWWDVLARDLGVPVRGADPAMDQPSGEPDHHHHANNSKPDSSSSSSSSPTDMSIVIIGMRGVGKTSLGRVAARELGREFVDLDELLERDVGLTIPAIINGSGWAAFREHETRVLAAALGGAQRTGAVVACGGGVVEAAENRAQLKRHIAAGGAVICLVPNMAQVAAYLGRDTTRPAFAAASDIHEVYARRLPLYAESCNYELLVDTALLSGASDGAATPGAWALIERDLVRLARFATGADLNRVDVARPSSCFLSLTAPDVREYLPARLGVVTEGAHAIELRADLLLRGCPGADAGAGADAFVAYVHRQFTLLRHSSRLPIVFTVRSEPQGGAFPAAWAALQARLLRCAVRWGAEYVDVEISDAEIKDSAQPLALAPPARQRSLLIASFHDTVGDRLRWGATPFGADVLARARAAGDIAKLVSVARTWDDNMACQAFVREHHSAAASLIALNMGERGRMSRVLCPCLTPVTHPLLGAAAAPGQISAAQINQARALCGLLPAQRFVLFGSPIAASPSPAMHNAGFAHLGLPHTYGLCETADPEAVRAAMAQPDFGGASVTIPLKEAVIPLLGALTPAARCIGAVNTVIRTADRGLLLGDNTDYLGIVGCLQQAQLDAQTAPFAAARALVIGAGGTSRAALYALHALGVPRVAVFNRTPARAQALADEFARLFAELRVVERLEDAAGAAYVIGTTPASDLCLPDALFAAPGVALDMAYKPRWTPLLEAAARRKWAVVHGVAVLIEQGIHQMERWTGAIAPARPMGDAVHAKYATDC